MSKCPHCTCTLDVRKFLSGRGILWRARCPNGSCPYAINERVAESKKEAGESFASFILKDKKDHP